MAGLRAEIRRQRYTGQSRIITALDAIGALDPGLDKTEAADIVYALLSPEVHRILTVERGWSADRYEHWIARSLATLLPAGQRPPANPESNPRSEATRPAPRLPRPNTPLRRQPDPAARIRASLTVVAEKATELTLCCTACPGTGHSRPRRSAVTPAIR
jgi:hypothetical protein